MEDYNITNLYIDNVENHIWQSDILRSMSGIVAAQAPKKSGKTYMCRDEILDRLCYGDEGETILYYSPEKGAAARMAFGSRLLLENKNCVCDYTRTNVYVADVMDCGTALYAPSTMIAMARLLASGMKFSEIIIDDAEEVKCTIMHTALLKASVDACKLFAVGSFEEENLDSGKKSLWKWLLNSPSADTYIVQYSGQAGLYDPNDNHNHIAGLAKSIRDIIINSGIEPEVA